MTCWWHKWRTVYQSTPKDGVSFRHVECRNCLTSGLISKTPFFSGLGSAIGLGIAQGIYKACNSHYRWEDKK